MSPLPIKRETVSSSITSPSPIVVKQEPIEPALFVQTIQAGPSQPRQKRSAADAGSVPSKRARAPRGIARPDTVAGSMPAVKTEALDTAKIEPLNAVPNLPPKAAVDALLRQFQPALPTIIVKSEPAMAQPRAAAQAMQASDPEIRNRVNRIIEQSVNLLLAHRPGAQPVPLNAGLIQSRIGVIQYFATAVYQRFSISDSLTGARQPPLPSDWSQARNAPATALSPNIVIAAILQAFEHETVSQARPQLALAQPQQAPACPLTLNLPCMQPIAGSLPNKPVYIDHLHWRAANQRGFNGALAHWTISRSDTCDPVAHLHISASSPEWAPQLQAKQHGELIGLCQNYLYHYEEGLRFLQLNS